MLAWLQQNWMVALFFGVLVIGFAAYARSASAPPWIAAYATSVLTFLGLAKDSTRPNFGALMLLSAIVLIAMRWTPIEGAGFAENVEAMVKAAGESVTKWDNVLGVFLGLIGLRQMQAPSTSAPAFTKAVGESLVKIEAVAEAEKAAPPAAGG